MSIGVSTHYHHSLNVSYISQCCYTAEVLPRLVLHTIIRHVDYVANTVMVAIRCDTVQAC